MNCRPGDLAIIIRSQNGNAGRIVEVMRPTVSRAGWWVVQMVGRPGSARNIGDEAIASNLFERQRASIQDANLRPIRDSPGEDETLKWMPVPQEKVTA